MSDVAEMPKVRGKLTRDAPLAPLVWFKSGGNAEWLFEPADAEDLADFLRALDSDVPLMALGLGSNMIVRDGGVPGDLIICMGAGDITKWAAGLADGIGKARASKK